MEKRSVHNKERQLLSKFRETTKKSKKVDNTKKRSDIFRCNSCQYTTMHKGHFQVHKEEGCKTATPIKEKNCPVCCKPFTYNRLRYHLQQYLIDSSKATNGHDNFTPEQHKNILKKLTAQRKLEKEEEKIFKNKLNCK